MTRIVNISEAKAQLSRLVEEARQGRRVVIGKAGRPVAVLTAYDEDPEARVPGGWTGEVWIADDFDDPLPDALQALFGGREP
jgi:prevent-host-death family protein